MGVEPIPPRWTIERVIAAAGLARPRRRQAGYVSKGVPYPNHLDPEPGAVHQIDMVGPRHLDGAIEFHALNLIDMGSHAAGSTILSAPRPTIVAAGIAQMWGALGVPAVAQFDNHSNFRGAIPPAWSMFGPVVATCLDLDVVPRFIPLREPWRNGVVEHFNDVWDKSFFRTDRFQGLEHLVAENSAFVAFHNEHHRYSAHGGASPDEVWAGRTYEPLLPGYAVPSILPAKGRIEVVRYIRSNRRLELFGKRVTLAEEHTHQYVVATIRVRSKEITVVNLHGEIVHDGAFALSRSLR
jgi:putative transposase